MASCRFFSEILTPIILMMVAMVSAVMEPVFSVSKESNAFRRAVGERGRERKKRDMNSVSYETKGKGNWGRI